MAIFTGKYPKFLLTLPIIYAIHTDMNQNQFYHLFENSDDVDDFWTLADQRDIQPKKQIAFLISDQHLIKHGGIGQFAKAFVEMCLELQCRVDIILDKKPTNELANSFNKYGVNFYYNDQPYNYSDHQNTFKNSDSINIEKMANFNIAIQKATKDNKYDLFVCNTVESIMPAYLLNCRPLVIYTHLYRQIYRDSDVGKFLETFHNFTDMVQGLDGIILATQSIHNKNELSKYYNNIEVLPMPMPDRKFLHHNNSNKEGVLFVGRHESGKRPDKFLEICKQANLPVKILTSKRSAIKFRDKCQQLGLKYDIRSEIIGQEKVDFMLTSKVHLNVSKNECYSFSTYECLGHMPVITLDDQVWTDNFTPYIIKANKSNIVDTLVNHYNNDISSFWHTVPRLQYINQLHFDAIQSWKQFLDIN